MIPVTRNLQACAAKATTRARGSLQYNQNGDATRKRHGTDSSRTRQKTTKRRQTRTTRNASHGKQKQQRQQHHGWLYTEQTTNSMGVGHCETVKLKLAGKQKSTSYCCETWEYRLTQSSGRSPSHLLGIKGKTCVILFQFRSLKNCCWRHQGRHLQPARYLLT